MSNTSSIFSPSYLLKTENLNPLIETVLKLTKQIDENQIKINHLCQFIDGNLKFPSYLTSQDEPLEQDQLRHLLVKKYNFIPSSTGDKMRDLQCDITKLDQIVSSKKRNNQCLMQVVTEYETNMIEVLIPSLVSWLKQFELENKSNLNRLDEMVNQSKQEIYQLYVMYVRRITIAIEVIKKLNKLVEDEKGMKLQSQLLTLNCIKENISR